MSCAAGNDGLIASQESPIAIGRPFHLDAFKRAIDAVTTILPSDAFRTAFAWDAITSGDAGNAWLPVTAVAAIDAIDAILAGRPLCPALALRSSLASFACESSFAYGAVLTR